MCIILFSYLQHPRYRLILTANRDEFYGRATEVAGFWEDKPDLLAGKDKVGGGTWIGMHKSGRWSALTNYRVPMADLKPDAKSRGHLTYDFLTTQTLPTDYIQTVGKEDGLYNGYNLLASTPTELAYYSNIQKTPQILSKGIYGVSNAFLDTDWQKVQKGKTALQSIIAEENFSPYSLLDMMQDTEKAPHERLPKTGVPLDWEHALSSIFIEMPERAYGTCCTTVLLITHEGEVHFIEKSYVPARAGLVEFKFQYPA